eukprot:tig00020608_g11937.t3
MGREAAAGPAVRAPSLARALGSPIAPLALSCPARHARPASCCGANIETMAFADSYPNHYTLGALAATLTWLLGGTPTASAVIGVGFGYAAKTLYTPGSYSQATAGMRPAGR